MNNITYILWKWNDDSYSVKYTAEHVNIMASMIARNTKAPHRIICITDDPAGILCETFPLWSDFSTLKNMSWEKWDTVSREKNRSYPSCYRRLKIFSPHITRALGINDRERVVSMDLDMVITNTLDSLFEVDTDFIGWHPGQGSAGHKIAFNGSIFMFRAGTCGFLWDEFDPIESPKISLKAEFYGSDQGWISYRIYDKSSKWTVADGIHHYYPKLCSSLGLSQETRIAVFSGPIWKPWHTDVILRSPWVAEHYRQ
jgi:hypothetical protein